MNPIRRRVREASLILLLAGAATLTQAQSPQPAQQQPGQTQQQPGSPAPSQPAATPDQSPTLSPLASLKPQTANAPYEPITARQRLQWFITQTIGPVHLLGGHYFRRLRDVDGSPEEFEPAYARYVAVAGNNFLSNTWRVKSEADTSHALERTAEGIAGRMASNAWEEFWPSVSSHLFHHDH